MILGRIMRRGKSRKEDETNKSRMCKVPSMYVTLVKSCSVCVCVCVCVCVSREGGVGA